LTKLGPDDVRERLAAVCVRHLGGAGSIERLRHLTGGASQETWSFDFASDAGALLPLILRRNVRSQFSNLASATEFALIEAAAAGGVPVPATHHLLSAEDGLGDGYIMGRVEGETIPRKILRDARYNDALPRMTAQAGGILARIHALDVSDLPGLPSPDAGVHPAAALLAQFRTAIDRFGEPHPAFELAMRWLEDEIPPQPRRSLVHGDFRNGNLIVGPDGIQAVLDWELAHVGDPLEDLGWLCVKSWRFGVVDKAVGGFGHIEELCAAYEAAGGRGADPERVRYWIAMGTLRWGVICQMQAFTHRSGMSRSVELAAIGRRVCETEWDLLDLVTA
jgi:aminoglycoside phosphotransferase (APT) family kinase protein